MHSLDQNIIKQKIIYSIKNSTQAEGESVCVCVCVWGGGGTRLGTVLPGSQNIDISVYDPKSSYQ